MIYPLNPKVEVFLEDIWPRASLGRITSNPTNGRPLNLYFLEGRGSFIDCDFSLTKKYSLTFPITG